MSDEADWLVTNRFTPYVDRPEEVALDLSALIGAPRQRTIQDALTEPTPCDGCWRVARCRAENLACSAFALFVNSPANAPHRWRLAPRNDASADRYERLNGPQRKRVIARRMLGLVDR